MTRCVKRGKSTRVSDAPSIRPWDRQEYDTDRSFIAFTAYLHQGPGRRSLRKIAKELGYADKTSVCRWSYKHQWIERVRAYDDAKRLKVLDRVEEERLALAVEYEAARVKIQRQHLAALLGDVPDGGGIVPGLLGVTTDPAAKASAVVNAWKAIREGGGITPAVGGEGDEDDGIDVSALLVNELQDLARYLDGGQAQVLFGIVQTAIARREAKADADAEGG